MTRKKVTITDVAREAQVSISTVSRVVNGSTAVSPELAGRVQQAIKKLNYHPNALARSLRSKSLPSIGVVLPDLNGMFFTQVFEGIERACAQHGRLAYVANSNNDPENEILYTRQLLNIGVEGIIYIGAFGWEHQDHIVDACSQGTPVVLINREIDACRADQVLIDREKGMYLATNHLIGLGHRRIGCLAVRTHGGTTSEQLDGFHSAMEDAGITSDVDLLMEASPDIQSGALAAEKLLSSSSPSAVFATSDTLAIALLHAASELGISVPLELSVVGFGDIRISRYVTPPITTVHQPMEDMGERAVQLLFERMTNPELEARRVLLEPGLIMRGSTARHKILKG